MQHLRKYYIDVIHQAIIHNEIEKQRAAVHISAANSYIITACRLVRGLHTFSHEPFHSDYINIKLCLAQP